MRTIAISVPDGDWCNDCDMLKYVNHASKYPHCAAFKEQPSKHPDNHNLYRKLKACRDAEIREG